MTDEFDEAAAEAAEHTVLPPDQQLASRLVNWKFHQAQQHLRPDHSIEVRQIVQALAATFGDCGWSFGGHMETIISAAVYGSLVQLAVERLPAGGE
jgi:hypothetical protein